MNENSKQTTQKIIHTLDLPQDLFLGLPNISLCGNTEVYISNHQGILSYEEECANILVKDYQIQIKGRGLHIFSYSKDEVTIRGYIHSLEFL
ncbi:MAG: YabP/YqfC family sporulation protein [Agathobacter sp.]|nr:YabP/YqfC family sporulation protein [Agathobacter sp.]